MQPGLCFVSAPFGTKRLPNDQVVDFDRLYVHAVAPVVVDRGLMPVRADSLVSPGLTQRAVIEAIARAEVMIADISTHSPNVFYELGLRHALLPRATFVMAAEGVPVPFDLAALRIVTYPAPDQLESQDLGLVRERLAGALGTIDEIDVDSPFFQYFPVTPLVLPEATPGERRQREEANALRSRLVEARKLLPEEALPRLKELERDVVESGQDDNRFLTDLMMAYRDCAAWDDVIRLIDGFRPELRRSTVVAQHEASALNRRGLPGDDSAAEAILEALIDRIGPDSETYGMLGRIHKDRYHRTGNRRDLDNAISAYRRGWEADPTDFYPGINLATLLTVAADSAAGQELRDLLPRLRGVVDSRVSSPHADYWDLATSLELAVLERDWSRADTLIGPLRARAASPWMLETTLNNLGILLAAMGDDADRRELSRLLRRLRAEEAPR